MEAIYIQKEKVKVKVNLPYVEVAGEKLRRILRSHTKIAFYT